MQQKHEFSLGDRVELVRAPVNVERGPYKITGLMPEGRDGEPQYRIKGEGNGPERVVTQAEIASRPKSSVFDS